MIRERVRLRRESLAYEPRLVEQQHLQDLRNTFCALIDNACQHLTEWFQRRGWGSATNSHVDEWADDKLRLQALGSSLLRRLELEWPAASGPNDLQSPQSSAALQDTDGSTSDWDLFISHASEEKAVVVRPLAELFRSAGLRVWVDEAELTLGDSLRAKIDHGLAHSRFGLVVLSPSFFARDWPQRELNGLVARESDGQKVLLPIWHQVDQAFVARYSPMLADRLAVNTDKGLEYVVAEVLRVLKR